MGGMLEAISGPMFSGKSEELIRRLRREAIARRRVLAVKPKIDTRYANTAIASHSSIHIEAAVVNDTPELRSIVQERKPEVVGIDEAQFFDAGIVDYCVELRDSGVYVLAAFLNYDWRRQPFRFGRGSSIRHVGELLAHAQCVRTLAAVCTYVDPTTDEQCNGPAYYSQRLVHDGKVVRVGGQSDYAARCLSHHTIVEG